MQHAWLIITMVWARSTLVTMALAALAGCASPIDPVIRPTQVGELSADTTVFNLPVGLGAAPSFAGALGRTMLGGDSGLYELVDDHFELRDARPVAALAYLPSLGFIVVGAEGLALWDGALLRPTTINDVLDSSQVSALAVRGDELWITLRNELVRWSAGALERFDRYGDARVVTYRSARDLVLRTSDGTLSILREQSAAWTAQSLSDELTLETLVPSAGFRLLGLEANTGALVERFVSGGRAHYRPIAASLDPHAPGVTNVRALVTDPERGRTWAIADDNLYLVSSDRVDVGPRPQGLDRTDRATATLDGAIWLVFDGDRAMRMRSTHAISFAGEIMPLAERHCLRCHRANGVAATTLETSTQWRDYYDRIITLIDSREMPRDQATTVTQAERDLLIDWQATGFGE